LNLFNPPRIRLRLIGPAMLLIVAGTMIPAGLRHPSLSYINNAFNLDDVINNMVLYLPLGIALGGSSLLRAFLVGLSLSTGAEILQLGFVDRIPSFADIASNTGGAVAGYLAAKVLFRHRIRQPLTLKLNRAFTAAAIFIALLGTGSLVHPLMASDFSNWSPAFQLAAGNEVTGNRPWSGTISELCIYPFAMSAEQVEQLANPSSDSIARFGTPIAGPMKPDPAKLEHGSPLLSSQENLRLYNALVAKNQMTLLVWLRPNNLEQTGPARIVTYSQDWMYRNFTLAQIRNTLTFRLRTPASGLNGTNPALYTGPVLLLDRTSFVAAVYDGRVSSLYVDGKLAAHANLGAQRPRLPHKILPWLPGSLPIREIELCGAEVILSGLFSVGIFALCGVPRRRFHRYLLGGVAGSAIGVLVWVFAVSESGLGIRILLECVGAGLFISTSVSEDTGTSEIPLQPAPSA
jgi:concanavalin A-like lectin/glucanase superfamily protein/VanZ like protein